MPAAVSWRRISTTDNKTDSSVGLSLHKDGVSTKPGGDVDTDYVNRKDWISHGFNLEDEDFDRWSYQFACFMLLTVVIVGTTFVVKYQANKTWPNRDWVIREAFLELHRREKFGLPLVDPDFIARENIVLPSEEDLEEFDVII